MTNIRLLGFSIRISLSTVHSDWLPARREMHLLNPTVALPASLDETSWPGINESDVFFKTCLTEFDGEIDLSGNGLNLMAFIPFSWLDGFRCGQDLTRTCALIAGTSSLSSTEKLIKQYGQLVSSAIEEPALDAIRKKWNFLGYDVVDFDGTSLLSNCGFGAHWPQHWSTEFRNSLKADLNEFGLFVTEGVAEEFASRCDEDVSDHSPTLCVGLWINEPANQTG